MKGPRQSSDKNARGEQSRLRRSPDVTGKERTHEWVDHSGANQESQDLGRVVEAPGKADGRGTQDVPSSCSTQKSGVARSNLLSCSS